MTTKPNILVIWADDIEISKNHRGDRNEWPGQSVRVQLVAPPVALEAQ